MINFQFSPAVIAGFNQFLISNDLILKAPNTKLQITNKLQ